jgi:hypothetical protein
VYYAYAREGKFDSKFKIRDCLFGSLFEHTRRQGAARLKVAGAAAYDEIFDFALMHRPTARNSFVAMKDRKSKKATLESVA